MHKRVKTFLNKDRRFVAKVKYSSVRNLFERTSRYIFALVKTDAVTFSAVVTEGKGNTYGLEFFVQKKLTDNFFGILSYTMYRSLYSGTDGRFHPSSWDNRQLLSITTGYKFPRNWEMGLKFRYQGGAPFTVFDETLSRLNYLNRGTGTPDYSQLNAQRLKGFNSSDIRIDKKWDLNKLTIDLFLDVSNWYVAKNRHYLNTLSREMPTILDLKPQTDKQSKQTEVMQFLQG